MTSILLHGRQKGLRYRVSQLHWPLVIMLTMLAAAGVATLYSVAEGSWTPWAMKHGMRYGAALLLLIVMAMVSVRFWMSLAYPLYFLALAALVAVPFVGAVNMGAQRWLEFRGFQFQPSEAMKIGLVMALARYYHGLRAEQVSHILYLVPPLIMIGAPVGLVFIQPDLGTALL
ncbi:MAG: FtsW/RodA/SpoVE family cell cycle protein, partial [Pseudomonadota bacterium]